MKRYIYLLVSCLLLCSVSYAGQLDTGQAFEPCKVFDLPALDNLVAHVQPSSAVMDTSLTFERMQGAAVTSQARSQFERFHAHAIDVGGRLSRFRT